MVRFFDHAVPLNGDCADILEKLPSNVFSACLTDPPHLLRLMNKSWDYQVSKFNLWKKVLNILKPRAHLLSFAATRTVHRAAVEIEDAGFEIRD